MDNSVASFCVAELKEEAENEHQAEPSGSTMDVSLLTYKDPQSLATLTSSPPSMHQTLDLLLKRLQEKRQEGNRPDELSVSTCVM